MWLPTGNSERDAIDMQIESNLFEIRRLESTLENYEVNYSSLDMRIRQVRHNLRFLREEGSVVSIKEYSSLVISYKQLLEIRKNYLSKIGSLKHSISSLSDQVDKLRIKLVKMDSKVLEFKPKNEK